MATLKVVFKAIDEISSKFDEMTRSGERALEAFESTGTAADGALSKVSRTAEQTAKSTETATDTVNNLSTAVSNYDRATTQASSSATDLSEKTAETEKNLDEAAEAARKASEEVDKFGEESEESGKQSEESSKKSKDGIKELQNVLASAGIAAALNEIKNSFFDCSEAAAQFETSTAMVATIADTSEKSLKDISKEVRSYSTETGEAASDMAEATYQAISASVDTADAAAFAGTATKLAVGGFTSATTAVDVLTTAINAYGLAASDATQLSDYLITTQNLGKTSVDQLAQSVGKVIPLASAYGVQMDNLSSAYAVLTANGIATAEAGTYLKAMLNELGDTGSVVSETLLNSTGSTFAQLTQQGYSLGDVMAALGDAVDNDGTAFNALWSSSEAGIGALSLFNAGATKYNDVLASMQDSAGATAKAYSTMADTTDKSKQRMENSFNNLKISVGDVLNPALTEVYEGFTSIFAGMTDFVDEHPAVVAAVTAIAVGVGAFTGALAAYNLATTAAAWVTEAFTATLAANPFVLATAGIVAFTAAAVTLTGVLISQSDEYEGMTATCRDQYDEIRELNGKYEEACEQYGENSEAASSLRYQLDQLNDEFEANRQTVKEFVAECDGLVESHNKIIDSYNSSTSSIKDNELGTIALTQRLQELASQNSQTASSYTEMKAIIDRLNSDVPGLGLTYDGVTESVDATVDAIKKAAKAQADSDYKAEQQQTYVDLLKEQSSLESQIAEAEANLNAERERRGMRKDDITGDWVSGSGFWTEDSPWVAWTSDIDDYKKSLEELQAAYDENQQTLNDIEGEWRGVAEAAEEAQKQTVTYDEAISLATSSVQTDLDNLTSAYDKAFEAARTSIDGQIGLFDTMKTSSELSISDMEKAMQSQTDYLNLYAENLQKAAQYGLDDGLIKSLSDGSQESAGYINAIIQNIEKLGGSTEGMPAAASKFVEEFNSKFEETEKAKDAFADNIAKMETNFDSTMSEIESRMEKAVTNMDMADEAKKAAQDTIKAYCDAIRNMTGEAGSAAQAVANAAAAHLGGTSSTPTVTGHANGTLSAREDVYIAGEDGPELIIGARGSEVFPAQETERIIEAVNGNDDAQPQTETPEVKAEEEVVSGEPVAQEAETTENSIPKPETGPEVELPEIFPPEEPRPTATGAAIMQTEEIKPTTAIMEPAPQHIEEPTRPEMTAAFTGMNTAVPAAELPEMTRPVPEEPSAAPEPQMQPAEAGFEPVEANYTVSEQNAQEEPPVPSESVSTAQAPELADGELPDMTIPEQPDAVLPEAEPTDALEESAPTVEPEIQPELTAQQPEEPSAALPAPDLPDGVEVVKEYFYLSAGGQGSDMEVQGIEPVEPELVMQQSEETPAPAEAPVKVDAPAVSAKPEAASVPDTPAGDGESVKRIVLEINGNGSIDATGASEETILGVLVRHVKPVLMDIIKGEIFEEGELAYDF